MFHFYLLLNSTSLETITNYFINICFFFLSLYQTEKFNESEKFLLNSIETKPDYLKKLDKQVKVVIISENNDESEETNETSNDRYI